ncbi:hypothetical protein [Methylococcus sp. Mc7]|uniref:hypothetical protein n=1 Tax=Methylococcus sp. Mc7 TaxID=2860258 RepID=UPI001C52A38B|nr:hypothetical protein [Methylococcus sp. Mc7]QXP84209.1 hypothetical protein KW115_00045 [Methylococcus sp. Mc7]
MGIALFVFFLGCGLAMSRRLFAEHSPWVRAWAGLAGGLLGLIWLPAATALLTGFTPRCQWIAAGMMGVITLLTLRFAAAPVQMPTPADRPSRAEIGMVALFTLLICLLLYTHVIYPDADGGLSVGQSTYGDLALHLGIVTSIAEQGEFPPDYSIFPGHRLNYPFLVNSLSASLYLLGTPLRWAVLLPSFVMAFCVVAGFTSLAREILQNRSAVLWAQALFFLNGGFGFAYFLEGATKNPENFFRIFTGFYQTPTNLVEENIRWSNVICDMLVPQRTTLAGWCFLMLYLWLLYVGLTRHRRKYFIAAGIGAGLLPMIHTHSFLGLGIVSAIWLWVFMARQNRRTIKPHLRNWILYGAIAVGLAAPQLFAWTFQQADEGGFLKFHLDWANHGDIWPWFWVKNVGLVFVLLPAALWAANRRMLAMYSGAVGIFLLADLVLFQPNEYDNNKLFYVWYLLSCILVGGFLRDLHGRLEGLRGRWIASALILFVASFSAILSIGREVVSDYQLFDRHQVLAAEFIRAHTPKDALFITSDNHNNPVAALAGRNILVGTPIYLFFHGIGYDARWSELERMYTDPGAFPELRAKYQVDYVYFSSYERDKFKLDGGVFEQRYPRVFASGDIGIYAVSPRAIAAQAEPSRLSSSQR